MAIPVTRVITPRFGQPVLRYANNGMAGWCKENSLSQWQKGSGWTANLYGGLQSGNDDWAALFVPVNEIRVADFKQALWTYYMTNAETMGVNIVIWVHDPNDNDKRAEITQLANISGLEKAAGWNAHELNITTDQFFWYGENVTNSAGTATALTEGVPNYYGWDDYQADLVFKHWTIYRISLEYGWDASGTFDDAWVADLKINGEVIPLRPGLGDHVGGEVKTLTAKTTGTSTTKATLLTPAAAKRVRVLSVTVTNLGATGTEIEVYFDTGTNIDSTPANAVFAAWCDTDTQATHSQSWPDGAGPVGGVGAVVSIRTSADITTNGRVTIAYREE